MNMNMNVENWELKDSCDVIPHKGNHFRWLLRIGFKSTFDKWGDVEYEDNFDTFPLLAEFMSNEKHLKEIELIKGE